MTRSLLHSSRVLHRRIAILLFAFFAIIAITGLMLGWKSLFTRTLYEDRSSRPSADMRKWLPLDSLERAAVFALKTHLDKGTGHAQRIEMRPGKGYIYFYFSDNYNVQVDGLSGKPLVIEQKQAAWIQDLHDGAILDEWFGGKSAIAKKTYSSVTGLALLFLTITGFYLWYKPKMIRRSRLPGKREHMPAIVESVSDAN